MDRLRALVAHPPGRAARRRPGARRGRPALSEPPARRPLITGEGRVATARLARGARPRRRRAPGRGRRRRPGRRRPGRAGRRRRLAGMGGPAPARAGARRSRPTPPCVDAEQPALAELVHRETGKPLGEAQAEVARAAEVVHHFAAEAERMWAQQLPGADARHRQLGAARPRSGWWPRSRPWNFPVALVVWKLAPALAAGCTVVVKPAIEAPLAAWALCDLAERAGLPPGPRELPDRRRAPRRARPWPPTRRSPRSPSPDRGRVAEQIAGWAAPRLKALSLELGGHGALVVLPDADLDVAAEVATDPGLRQLRAGLLRGQPGAGAPAPGGRSARAHARPHRRHRARADDHRPRPGAPPHAAGRGPGRRGRGRGRRGGLRPGACRRPWSPVPARACGWSTRSPSPRSWP